MTIGIWILSARSTGLLRVFTWTLCELRQFQACHDFAFAGNYRAENCYSHIATINFLLPDYLEIAEN
jgi:hypothetical protein